MKAPNLEAKERQMLELLAGGASTRVISKKMGYTEGTVRVYLHNLYKKIGVRNRTEALLWQLDHTGAGAERAAAEVPRSAVPHADETFGDVALRDGLLGALGIMESFTGPYGRLWEVGARLKGTPIDAAALAAREDSRTLWRALLQGTFGYGKTLADEGFAQRWVESAPSEAVLLACLLLLGGYSRAADTLVGRLAKVRRGGRAASGRELTLLRALREALHSDDEASLGPVHSLAIEKAASPAAKQLAMVAMFHVYRQRKDAERARETANVIWAEAESARRQLEAMGVRPLAREASLPKPGRAAVRAREKVAAGN